MKAKTTTMTGTRSSEAPSSVAIPKPISATSARLTTLATSVPASPQAASVLSAPKRRNQRNPYTDETALPAGREFVNACAPNETLSSGPKGARSLPASSSSYCMAAKQTYDPISAAKAGGTHHQFTRLKTSPNPASSEPFEERTHAATPTRPSPTRTRTTGQVRRRRPGRGRSGPGVSTFGSGAGRLASLPSGEAAAGLPGLEQRRRLRRTARRAARRARRRSASSRTAAGSRA